MKLSVQNIKKEKKRNIYFTSGSLVSWFVWINILPIFASLHTSINAGSKHSPARTTDTAQTYILNRLPWSYPYD